MLHLRLHSSVFGIVQTLHMERAWHATIVIPHDSNHPFNFPTYEVM